MVHIFFGKRERCSFMLNITNAKEKKHFIRSTCTMVVAFSMHGLTFFIITSRAKTSIDRASFLPTMLFE
jgi:hypothetical protein